MARSLRIFFVVIAALAPVHTSWAWQFTSQPVCTVSDDGSATRVRVTFDGTLYAIHLTHPDGWPEAARFAIRFTPNGPEIATDRHRIDGDTLTVTDSGFGNVLNGLQFNQTATALIGGVARPIDLTGAAGPVEAFRACPSEAVARAVRRGQERAAM